MIHALECAFDFDCHLHNGDPLTARTVRAPKGQAGSGAPPFTWWESAVDALRGRDLDALSDWPVGAPLDRLERYNGLGYRRRGLASPDLWSFSGHNQKGKYAADGRTDPEDEVPRLADPHAVFTEQHERFGWQESREGLSPQGRGNQKHPQ